MFILSCKYSELTETTFLMANLLLWHLDPVMFTYEETLAAGVSSGDAELVCPPPAHTGFIFTCMEMGMRIFFLSFF